MAEKDYQDDFFGEELYEKKDRKPHLLSRYSEQRFLPHIRIPIEHTVIIAIGILVLVIVAYAVGVEKGKRITARGALEPQAVSEGVLREETAEEESTDFSKSEELTSSENEAPGKKIQLPKAEIDPYEGAREEAVVQPAYSYTSPAYAVQVASFKNEGSAQDEVNRLRRRGAEADFEENGLWYQVYVGPYKTVEEARRAREGFLSEYSDCYIRKLR